MSHQYSKQTRKMIEDLLETLESRARVDPQFLVMLRQLSEQKQLDKATHVKKAIQSLRDSFDVSR